MPNCFQLTNKKTGEVERLVTIDEKICDHLGVTPDPVQWYHCWMDTIGLSLAVGHSWEKMRETFAECDLTLKIIDFLEENYTSDAWYQHK